MLQKSTKTSVNPDRVAWDSFKDGNRDAFAHLYSRYFSLLVRNSTKYSNDESLIEDCIHDLFLEIWNNKMNLVTPTSVQAYLLCSAQRKIFKQIRRIRKVSGNPEFFQEMGFMESIEEKIIGDQRQKENKMVIKEMIGTLTKRQREAISLRFYQNMAYPEIADKMGIGTASVYNLISKALEAIRMRMSQRNHSSQRDCLN